MTNILRWDRPKKVQTTQQWAESYGFDGGPRGGYQPNMSEADKLSWKAKITGKKLGYPQVEIRKTTQRGSQVVIIVNLGNGYNYKQYEAENSNPHYRNMTLEQYKEKYQDLYDDPDSYFGGKDLEQDYIQQVFPTRGINVHIATNGPIQMTFEEMQEMQIAISEAEQALSSLENP